MISRFKFNEFEPAKLKELHDYNITKEMNIIYKKYNN